MAIVDNKLYEKIRKFVAKNPRPEGQSEDEYIARTIKSLKLSDDPNIIDVIRYWM